MKLTKSLGIIFAAGAILIGTAVTFDLNAQDEQPAAEEAAAPAADAPAAEGEAAPAGDAAAAPAGDAAAADQPADQPAPQKKETNQFIEAITAGGMLDHIVWVLIGLTSLATVSLIIDSFISIRMSKIMPMELVDAVKYALDQGDLGAAIEACEATPGPLSNILMAGFNNITEGYDVILDAVSSAASIESEKLMQRVNYLNLCGQLGPMFGLMGTVTGMVGAFAGMASESGAAKAQQLANNISSALYTTAVGLFIAIPAILGFTFVKNTASKIILTMEALTYDLIKGLRGAEVADDSGEEAAAEEAVEGEEVAEGEEAAEGEEVAEGEGEGGDDQQA